MSTLKLDHPDGTFPEREQPGCLRRKGSIGPGWKQNPSVIIKSNKKLYVNKGTKQWWGNLTNPWFNRKIHISVWQDCYWRCRFYFTCSWEVRQKKKPTPPRKKNPNVALRVVLAKNICYNDKSMLKFALPKTAATGPKWLLSAEGGTRFYLV